MGGVISTETNQAVLSPREKANSIANRIMPPSLTRGNNKMQNRS